MAYPRHSKFVRFESYEQVVAAGAEAQRKLLQSGDPSERVWAAWALGVRLGGESLSIINAAGEPHAGVRRQLVVIVASLGPPEAVEVLATADPDADVRATAVDYVFRTANAESVARRRSLVESVLENDRASQVITRVLRSFPRHWAGIAPNRLQGLLARGDVDVRNAVLEYTFELRKVHEGYSDLLHQHLRRETDRDLLVQWVRRLGDSLSPEIIIAAAVRQPEAAPDLLPLLRRREEVQSLLAELEKRGNSFGERLFTLARKTGWQTRQLLADSFRYSDQEEDFTEYEVFDNESGEGVIAFEPWMSGLEARADPGLWYSYLSAAGKRVFEYGNPCGTCGIVFRRVGSVEHRLSDSEAYRLLGSLDVLPSESTIGRLARVLPASRYISVIVEGAVARVEPGAAEDYFTTDVARLFGPPTDQDGPYGPDSPYFRFGKDHTLERTGRLGGPHKALVTAVVMPLHDPNQLDRERIDHYKKQHEEGVNLTAFAVAVVDCQKPATDPPDISYPYAEQFLYVNCLIDGHHRIQAASELGVPLRILSLVATEYSSADKADYDKVLGPYVL